MNNPNFFRHKCVIAILLIMLGSQACHRVHKDPQSHTVLLHITKQAPDYASPWLNADASSETHIGAYVGDSEFLTTAFAVYRSSMIEIEFLDNNKRVPATIVFSDNESNLAIVKPQTEFISDHLRPLDVAESVEEGDEVFAVIQKSEGRVEAKQARVSEVAQRASLLSPYQIPSIEIEISDQRRLGWSEPVIGRNKLVGLTTGAAGEILVAIESSVISHFLNDLRSKKYRGFPALGITTRALVSPDYRRLLGTAVDGPGVLIQHIHPSSAFADKLQREDVLTHVDGVLIDQRGNINHESFGRIAFSYLLTQKYAGDEVELTVQRGGKEFKTAAMLRRFDSRELLIPHFTDDGRQPYLIVGGFIFQELNLGLFESFGKAWPEQAPPHWVMRWNYDNQSFSDKVRRVVVLTRVLADRSNDGYHELENLILDKVNGIEVDSLSELVQSLRGSIENTPTIARFDFELDGGIALVRLDELVQVHERLARNLNIPPSAAFFSRQ
jgi:S1-C subfamily serine protease